MIPTKGRTVFVRTAADFNGSQEHAAVVTKYHDAGNPVINATVFPDASPVRYETSVRFFDSQQLAEAALADGSARAPVAYWPPKV